MVAGTKASFDDVLKDPLTRDPRVTHVRFADMIKDPVAVIAPLYEAHGLTFSASFEATLRRRLADPAHRADRHGKFAHSNADFGLDTMELKRLFADYRERFGL